MSQLNANEKYTPKLLSTCRIFVVLIISNCAFFQGEDPFWKEDGDMITTKIRPNLHQSDYAWEPNKCSMHMYDSNQFKSCWGSHKSSQENTNLLFIGDSHEKNMFSSFAYEFRDGLMCNSSRKDVRSTDYCTQNESRLSFSYQFLSTIDEKIRKQFQGWEERSFVPDFIMIGCNLHPILNSNASNSYRHEYRKNFTNFLPYLDHLSRKAYILWYLQPPVNEAKMKASHEVIDNKNVDYYNEIAKEELSRTRVILWTSAREIAIDELDLYVDGPHVSRATSLYFLQILTNFWCNHRFNYQDGTCCKRRKRNDPFIYRKYFIISQIIFLIVATLITKRFEEHFFSKSSPATDMIPCKQNEPAETNPSTMERPSNLKKVLVKLWRLSKVWLWFGFVYICERIPIFMKDPFKVSPLFMVGSLIMTIILVFYSYEKFNEDVGILKRQLIDETKGLAIAILLFLKLCNSSTDKVNTLEHLIESTFIMMMGADIFYHSWLNKSMNIFNFLQKSYNQNVLVILLCLVLNKPFIHYEIFPLLLVCFTITYIVLALPTRHSLVYLKENELATDVWPAMTTHLFKILTLIGIFGLPYNLRKLEELFSYPLWRYVFATKEDTLDPWLHRWQLDKFSFLDGIVIGFAFEVHNRLSHHKIFHNNKLMLIIKGFLIPATIIFLAHKFYLGIESISSLQHDSITYPVTFGYLAFSYILLRSCLVRNCSYYSKILATLGRFWREIYLLHFHIWMAFDGNAFLVLLPFSSLINLCCITFVLLFISYDVRDSVYLFNNYKQK